MSTELMPDLKEWSRQMGKKHEGRDRAVALETQAHCDLERERHAACLQRWPSIVSAMRTLIDGYNEGTGLKTLTIVEDAVSLSVTVASSRNGHSSLGLALDGSDICVHTHHTHPSQASGPRWVSMTRTNDDVAEYLLRNWMEQL